VKTIMPQINFSDDIDVPGGGGMANFVKLESKGDKIKFRLANKPHVRAQHWPKDSRPLDCERVNNNKDCEYCAKLEEGEFPPGVTKEQVEKDARLNWYKPTIQFLYPILNRDTGVAQIFQTSTSVHVVIKDAEKAGIDVYKSDWQVTRNEGVPAKYYSVIRLDPVKLDAKDKAILEEANKIDLDAILGSSKESSMEGPDNGGEEDLVNAAEEVFGDKPKN